MPLAGCWSRKAFVFPGRSGKTLLFPVAHTLAGNAAGASTLMQAAIRPGFGVVCNLVSYAGPTCALLSTC